MQEAAEELKRLDVVPFAGMVSDPCDGRTQGTAGMMDSLPYRNDAAIVFRRLIRSLPRRKGVLGVATCDKGLPAMMMALAGARSTCLGARSRRRDAAAPRRRGRRQDPVDGRPLLARRAEARRGRRAGLPGLRQPGRRLPVPGHRGDLPGRGRGAGHELCRTPRSFPPASRSGATWPGGRPGRVVALARRGSRLRQILTDAAIRNAMTVHAAFGGSTNLLLHIPAIAFAAGLRGRRSTTGTRST